MPEPQVNAETLAKLVAIVQRMVNESGDPSGFNANAWTLDWVTPPVPALGMACPAEFMQTEEGLSVVETLRLQIESGANS